MTSSPTKKETRAPPRPGVLPSARSNACRSWAVLRKTRRLSRQPIPARLDLLESSRRPARPPLWQSPVHCRLWSAGPAQNTGHRSDAPGDHARACPTHRKLDAPARRCLRSGRRVVSRPRRTARGDGRAAAPGGRNVSAFSGCQCSGDRVRGDEKFEVKLLGQTYVQAPFVYQRKCLAALRKRFAALNAAGLDEIGPLLEETGCLPYFSH